MIQYSDVIKAVNGILKDLYPKIRRYGNDTVDKAVPPYFFVECVPTDQNHESVNLQNNSCSVYINYIQKTPDQVDNLKKYQEIFDALGMTLDIQDPEHSDVVRHLTYTNYYYTYTGENRHDLQIRFDLSWYESTQETPDEKMEVVALRTELKEEDNV